MSQELKDYIRAHLQKRGGRESVSALIAELRQPMPGGRCYGPYPKFPTNHSRAMAEFEKLGFRVVDAKKKYNWDVILPLD